MNSLRLNSGLDDLFHILKQDMYAVGIKVGILKKFLRLF